MVDRPTLSLSSERAALAKERIAQKLAAASEMQTPPPEQDAPLPAGCLAALLGIKGNYDVHGRFVPHKGHQPRVGTPRVRGVYWCKFTDSVFPEFGKERPVIVVSAENKAGTYSLVVPVTTVEQDDPCSVRLSKCPNPNLDKPSWAVASHVYAVSHWRLRRFWDNTAKRPVLPRVDQEDYQKLMSVLMRRFALPRDGGAPGKASETQPAGDGAAHDR